MKYHFRNDYSEGAHPKLLEALAAASIEQNAGYGLDIHCKNAEALLRRETGKSSIEVHFFEGGTQANLAVISAFLRPHEAAVAAVTGHIAGHECGSVEATGHKVCTVEGVDGKLTPEAVRQVLSAHPDEHMVKPRLVYISNSTEVGTIYSKVELTALRDFCRENGLWLFLDGARLGSALTAQGNDLTLADLARLTDAFYIGGTKNGALFGEALVLCGEHLPEGIREDFRYVLKQRGAMLAKGMVLGAQFEALFTDGLYYRLAAHANEMAQRLKDAFREAGFRFLAESPTNQLFPILPDALIARLAEEYSFESWKDCGADGKAVRFVTSWATPEAAVAGFIEDLMAICISNHF